MLPMLSNVVRNLFGTPATEAYPFQKRELEGYRGKLANDIESCIFCGACARVCPSRCIVVDAKGCTFECDPNACVQCGVCEEACPTGGLTMTIGQHRAAAYVKEAILQQGERKSKEQIMALRKRKQGA
jgi:ech hydrogenase subunit F